jgi:putative ABC transport system substrate-binding protein
VKRRTFIAGLAGAAAWPVVARAQQPGMPVIGWLSTRNSQTDGYVLPAFRQGLNRQGYVEGRNVTIEYRWSETQNDRLPVLAADLVRRQVAVLVTAGEGASVVQAVQAITTTIPIVTTFTSRDMAFRRAASNVTGVYSIFVDLGGKRIGLLHDLLPRATTIAVLTTPTLRAVTDVQEAARALGLQIKILIVGSDRELDAALASLAQMPPDALVVGAGAGPLFFTRADKIVADLRWYGDATNQMGALAQELVGLQPDIIMTGGTSSTAAIQRETRTIPIVFASVTDPVASGILARLDRPSGNITGFANLEASLGGKWLEVLSEIAPGLKRAAIMFNPDVPPASTYMASFETGARSLRVELITEPVHSDGEIETAIIAIGREPGGGLIVMPGAFTAAHRAPIILAAARNNVPAVYPASYFARDGGLLSYGPDRVDTYRRAASYVDRILRGAKPGDLPVHFPTKFEMVLNLKTAKALRLTVPQSILLRAEEVIE